MFSSKLLQCFNLVDSPLGLYCGRRSTACANQPPVALYPVNHQLVIDSYLTYLGKTILPDEELVWKEALSTHTKEELDSQQASKSLQASLHTRWFEKPENSRTDQTRPGHTHFLSNFRRVFSTVWCCQQHFNTSSSTQTSRPAQWNCEKLRNPCLHNWRRHLPPGRSVALPDLTFRGRVDKAWGASVFKEPSDRKDL